MNNIYYKLVLGTCICTPGSQYQSDWWVENMYSTNGFLTQSAFDFEHFPVIKCNRYDLAIFQMVGILVLKAEKWQNISV